MAKIFLVFHNGICSDDSNAIPCFYESLIRELSVFNRLLIHHHKLFGSDFGKIPHDILEQIKTFNPDLIILFNNSFYDLSDHFDCPIIIYEVDSPIYYSNKESIKRKSNRYKYFVPQSISVEILNKEFNIDKKNILYTPFFTSITAEDIPQNTNICFIGTKFAITRKLAPYNNFMLSNPSYNEIKIYKDFLVYIKKHPFAKDNEIINKFNLGSDKIINNLNISDNIEFIAINERVKILSQIADLGLDIYGPPGWINDLPYEPELVLNYINSNVYSIRHNQDIYNGAKIGVNVNHTQAATGFSWRVCDIMASNACLVSEYKSDFDRLFPNLPIPTFTNKFEAREICKKLLDEENLRKDIVLQCQEVINNGYRFNHFLKPVEEFLGMKLQIETVFDATVENYPLYLENSLYGKYNDSDIIQNTPPTGAAIKEDNINSHNISIKRMPINKFFILKLKLKRKLTNFIYLFILLIAQIPKMYLLIPKHKQFEYMQKIYIDGREDI